MLLLDVGHTPGCGGDAEDDELIQCHFESVLESLGIAGVVRVVIELGLDLPEPLCPSIPLGQDKDAVEFFIRLLRAQRDDLFRIKQRAAQEIRVGYRLDGARSRRRRRRRGGASCGQARWQNRGRLIL